MLQPVRDSASEVLTTAIKAATLTTTIRIVLPKEIFEEYVIKICYTKILCINPILKILKVSIYLQKLNCIDTRVS